MEVMETGWRNNEGRIAMEAMEAGSQNRAGTIIIFVRGLGVVDNRKQQRTTTINMLMEVAICAGGGNG